jgi:hypothetical protein
MAGPSSDLVEHFKLETQFFPEYVVHHLSDLAHGNVAQTWSRRKILGQGGFGMVWLEDEKAGTLRAVKEVRKYAMEKLSVDYQKELIALAKLSKVRCSYLFLPTFCFLLSALFWLLFAQVI